MRKILEADLLPAEEACRNFVFGHQRLLRAARACAEPSMRPVGPFELCLEVPEPGIDVLLKILESLVDFVFEGFVWLFVKVLLFQSEKDADATGHDGLCLFDVQLDI